MRHSILASIHHGYSTDDFQQHQFCPPGPDSWCFYKQSIDGLKFFLSANNVVLSPGDDSGVIEPKFFSKVVDRRKGNKLPFQGCVEQLEENEDTEELSSATKNMVVTAEDIDEEFQKRPRRKKKNKETKGNS
ncbi:RNA 2'-phosphotransferase, tpt1/kpta family protein [Plakobranchus ocellatus]|uniref:RNA 2'-phosphotransferase, tpt1/kpta family protein n=1 Tax=Plakobranchus ocellatus TaxID=259542 RepID=A0AAV4BDP0_9GAST|nr:RNA 2'-phosphotransferase, tpt1/kpta family protein [Plakobranchus ocellatus]